MSENPEIHDSIFTQIETITPEKAEEWLATSTYNRAITLSRVDRYARAMLAGKWSLTGEPIIFSDIGALMQGHHRLNACIKSGVEFTTLVVRGTSDSARIATDSGRPWSFSDHLSAEGEFDSKTLAGAVVWIWRYKHNDLDAQRIAPEPQDLLACFKQCQDIRGYLTQAARIAGKTRLTRSVLVGSHHIAQSIDPEDAAFFYDKLDTGVELSSDSPILLLRSWAPRNVGHSTVRIHQKYLSAILIKAWNAYRAGDQLHRLVWRQGGSKPEPFPKMQ